MVDERLAPESGRRRIDAGDSKAGRAFGTGERADG
jgi:hypothetical protein